MRVSADHEIAREYQPSLGQQHMFYAHLADFKVICDIVPPGEVSQGPALIGALHVLGRREMVRHQGYLFCIKHLIAAEFLKFLNGDRSGYIIPQAQVYPGIDKLARMDLLLIRVFQQYLFRYRVWHMRYGYPRGCVERDLKIASGHGSFARYIMYAKESERFFGVRFSALGKITRSRETHPRGYPCIIF